MIGVLANTRDKELQRQKSRISAFLSIGKVLAFDADFSVLGPIIRNPHVISDAFSKVEGNENKIRYGLFWFTDAIASDVLALNHLRAGNTEKAIEVWTKIIGSGSITGETCSAFNNLGTLKLACAFKDGRLEKSDLIQGLRLKLDFIESDGLNHLIDQGAVATIGMTNQSHIRFFLEQILIEFYPYLEKSQTAILSDLKHLFSNAGVSLKSHFESIFSERSISQIESRVDETKAQRKSDASLGKTLGEILSLETRTDLELLRVVLDSENSTFQHVSDRLANEILQCGVDYFSAFRESNTIDPSNDTLRLFQSAKSIAIGTLTRDRINENLRGLQERKKQKKIQKEMDFIYERIEHFQKQSPSVQNVRTFVSSCKPILEAVAKTLTTEDDLYIDMSTAVAGNAQGALVEVFNTAQEWALSAPSPQTLQTFRGEIFSVIEMLRVLGLFRMSQDLRASYERNWLTISGIKQRVDAIAQANRNSVSSSGCYIATMSYHDLNHPKVVLLRNWRDNTLMHSHVGRLCVLAYNRYSPRLVVLLRNKHRMNSAIRFALDHFTKILEKRCAPFS